MFDLESITTVADIPRLHGQQRPTQRAQIFEGRETTYADFDRHTNQIANALAAFELPSQSRIGFLGKNSDYYFELLFGACKANVVVVGVNWRLAEPEVEYILNDADCQLLFVGAEYYAMAESLRARCPQLKAVIAMDGARRLGAVRSVARRRRKHRPDAVNQRR